VAHEGARLLSPESVREMVVDRMTAEERAENPILDFGLTGIC
jgi:hypothetical protein